MGRMLCRKAGHLKRLFDMMGDMAGLWLGAFMAAAVMVSGCADPGSNSKNRSEYLIRVGNRSATLHDFETAMELAMAGNSLQADESAAWLNKFRLLLLRQMIDELILLQRASELGIGVSDVELEQAITELKKDLPEDVFKQLLFENAIPYKAWKQRLKIRLTLEKVVEKELVQQHAITHEEIARCYDRLLKEPHVAELTKEPEKAGEMIIAYLRREKAETAYAAWLRNIQKRYKIEVNRTQWEKIAGPDTLPLIDAFAQGQTS